MNEGRNEGRKERGRKKDRDGPQKLKQKEKEKASVFPASGVQMWPLRVPDSPDFIRLRNANYC